MKELSCLIHDYNQSKYGVDVIDQCVGTYSVQRISRRWPLIVFYNMIDLAAINSMTLWLSQYPKWNQRKSNTRRIFLSQLSTDLTVPQNQRCSQESRLMPKVKLALLSLGYQVPSGIVIDLNVNAHTNRIKRRCYLCPAKPGRKVRQICDNCGAPCLICEKKN
ncbi:unnamed protein product [Didymodactylos carnosus]|uniref:PiggyBac transposable element-derived protein domain-containing protein n=1 Tax=Didymodactylos carnosus TaxID=1234261 RepID=A0A814ZGR6_9BILA|nr:unnamed protein product [Didymodactylos carnosus]CAF4007739.1 unnamed protein product [Didymodactylos carnosus]